MQDHTVVSREEWLKARVDFLEREKAFTKERDALSRERQALPWVEVTKDYSFDTPEGKKTLDDLFGKHSQLVVYHFMYGPTGRPDARAALSGRTISTVLWSTSLLAMSLSSPSHARRWRRWTVSRNAWAGISTGFPRSEAISTTTFDVSFTEEAREKNEIRYNYRASTFPADEAPGISVFTRGEDGKIYHSYSTYGRGLDMLNAGYHYLDLVPKGRDEDNLPYPMDWVRLKDEYGKN